MYARSGPAARSIGGAMFGAILALLANAIAVVIVAALLPNQMSFASWTAVAVFALIVGLLNAFLRPIVRFLTAPIGCLTLGLFSVVINGLMFWLAAQANVGVEATFLGATITALAAGVLNGLFGMMTSECA
jgi:putative membrane protein